jgi:hypothetical protein
MKKALVLIIGIAAWSLSHADALGDFRKKIDGLKAVQIGAYDISPSKQKGEWLRMAPAQVADLAYDVQQTSSLVSPYIAWVDMKVAQPVGVFSSEADARSSKPAARAFDMGMLYRVEFAYQDGRWVATRGHCDMILLAQSRKLTQKGEPAARWTCRPVACMGRVSPFVEPLLR